GPLSCWRRDEAPPAAWRDGTGEIGDGRRGACVHANLSYVRLSGPPAAADLGGRLHGLRRKALAARGAQARGVRVHALRRDVAREAGRRPGCREEVGGVAPEAAGALTYVRWRPGFPRSRSPPRRADHERCERTKGNAHTATRRSDGEGQEVEDE